MASLAACHVKKKNIVFPKIPWAKDNSSQCLSEPRFVAVNKDQKQVMNFNSPCVSAGENYLYGVIIGSSRTF